MKTKPLLALQAVSLSFGGSWLDRWLHRPLKRVLDEVDLQLFPGDSVALLGPNGAGKSSILRLCAGLYLPTSGTVVKRCETLFGAGGDRSFYERLTLEQNLAYFQRFSSLAFSVPAILERVGLLSARSVPWRQASTGMRARLVMARVWAAMAGKTAVLLLDEPERGLDEAGLALWGELGAELRSAGGAILTATHLKSLDIVHFSRSYKICDGRLEASDA